MTEKKLPILHTLKIGLIFTGLQYFSASFIIENSATKIKREDLRKLFRICTSQTHFLFNGNYYDQVDGGKRGSKKMRAKGIYMTFFLLKCVHFMHPYLRGKLGAVPPFLVNSL